MSIITWYDHSAFKIECEDASLVIDPYFLPGSGQKWEDAGKTDMVLVTHDHGDHVGNAVDICKKWGAMLGAIVGTAQKMVELGVPQNQILNGVGFNIGGTVTYKGMAVTMTQAFHSSDSSMPVGYIIRMPDGVVIYHAGDTGIFSSMALLGELYPIEVALLPIGGVFTMDGYQAAHACKLLKCKNVIPMHWGTFPVLAQSTKTFRDNLSKIAPKCYCVDMERGQSVEFGL